MQSPAWGRAGAFLECNGASVPLEVADVGAVSSGGDGVNHCSSISVARSLGFSFGAACMIRADAIATKSTHCGKADSVFKAKNFVRVLFHDILLCATYSAEDKTKRNHLN